MQQRKRWTEEQTQLLINNYGNMALKILSELLQHPIGSIQDKASTMGIRSPKIWREDEIEYLKANYYDGNMDDIKAHLKRAYRSILGMARRMKLSRNPKFHGRPGIARPKKDPKPRVYKARPTRQPKIQVEKIKPVNPRRAAMEKRLPDRPFTTEGKRLLRINKKTMIYVDAHLTAKQVKEIINKYSK